MIELVKAKTGDLTIRYEGKFLASSYDPRGEGLNWAKNLSAQMGGLKTAIVLGAGAGYHLEGLKKLFPHLQVICLERRSEIVEAVRSNLQISLLGIQVFAIESNVNVFNHELVKTALKSSYAVLRSQVSRHLDPNFYEAIQLDLNGRSQTGFQTICEIRGLDQPQVQSELQYFSYRDLKSPDPDENFERAMSEKIIKELVF